MLTRCCRSAREWNPNLLGPYEPRPVPADLVSEVKLWTTARGYAVPVGRPALGSCSDGTLSGSSGHRLPYVIVKLDKQNRPIRIRPGLLS